MKRTFSLILLSLFLSSCATSKITAFRDPAFATKQFDSISVFSLGMTLDAAVAVEQQLCTKIKPTPCVTGKSILPPTRQYSPEEVEVILSQSGVNAVLILTLVSDNSDTRYIGSITNSSAYSSANTMGSATLYGNNAYWNSNTYGSAYGRSLTTPIYSKSRVSLGELKLFDRGTGKIAWSGEIRIDGRGVASTDEAFINSATEKIAEELKTTGIIK